MWMPVDKWITCGLLFRIDKRVENFPRKKRAARDEGGEVRAGRRARAKGLESLVGRVDAAGGDDLDAARESLTQPAHVGERFREEGRAREPARLLREARLVHAAGVAAVHGGGGRGERGGDGGGPGGAAGRRREWGRPRWCAGSPATPSR